MLVINPVQTFPLENIERYQSNVHRSGLKHMHVKMESGLEHRHLQLVLDNITSEDAFPGESVIIIRSNDSLWITHQG